MTWKIQPFHAGGLWSLAIFLLIEVFIGKANTYRHMYVCISRLILFQKQSVAPFGHRLLWLHPSHLRCVKDSSSYGPRTLGRGQNNRKTTVGRTVPSLPCLTWKSCLSLMRLNMLGPKRGENYLRLLREKPKGWQPIFLCWWSGLGIEATTYCHGFLWTWLTWKEQDFFLKLSLLFP